MYLLRVRLPDQPGTLGTVATALGGVGADIVAVDVVERSPDGEAIDDFFVELPFGKMADELVSACQSIEGVRVIWFSRYDRGGNLGRDLEAVEAMTEAPARAIEMLIELAPRVFRIDWALLLDTDGGRGRVRVATESAPDLPTTPDEPAGRGERAGRSGAPIPWLPVPKPTRIELPGAWESAGWRNVSAAATPVGDAETVLVVGRGGGPDFLDSELARLGHLAGLAHAIQRAA